jgi:hypothetical protein
MDEDVDWTEEKRNDLQTRFKNGNYYGLLGSKHKHKQNVEQSDTDTSAQSLQGTRVLQEAIHMMLIAN